MQIAPREICQTPHQLSSCLNFSTSTLLNFLHFSKTGGTSVVDYLRNDLKRFTKQDGSSFRGFNTCYQMRMLGGWVVCDWNMLRRMNPEQYSTIDYIYGHQYYLDGAQDILQDKDVRTFTVIDILLQAKFPFLPLYWLKSTSFSIDISALISAPTSTWFDWISLCGYICKDHFRTLMNKSEQI